LNKDGGYQIGSFLVLTAKKLSRFLLGMNASSNAVTKALVFFLSSFSAYAFLL